MRRWALAVLACTLLAGCAGLLAGCSGLPAGVDGDLTNGWQPMAAATQFRPAAGTCHAELTQTGTADDYSPVPCTDPHLVETIAVTDVANAGLSQAFAACSKQATTFLGADWRTGWVVLQPVLPGKEALAGGAHWVRCDVAETSPVDGALVRRSATMKGAVKAGGKLRMACANPTIDGESVTEMHPVACATTHTAEFAGLFATTAKNSDDISSDALADGCDKAIAKFTGLRDDSNLESRIGWLGFPPDDTAWQMGDRAIRCFLWLNGEKMTGSYRNAGPSKLKIHYSN
ncbi:septum formation family protein [Actinoplanes sp. NPDC026619]|uniref:septum formation family protein n=1 Tax=Actinoplanes sp. NPDC026619 TaxID=3155798 RepID=UPI0033FBB739